MSSKNKKNDVTQKIQEIKQRQQNWLKQREQSRHDEISSAARKSSNGQTKIAKKPSGLSNPSAARINRIDSGDPKLKQTSRKQFANWVNARAKQKSTRLPAGVTGDHGDFTDCQSIGSSAESELERLVSPDEETARHRQPVDESNFEDLANEIANRVKEDLGLSITSSASGISASTGITLVEDDTFRDTARGQTYIQDVPVFHQIGSSGLASHNCSVCKKLMLSSKNIPMMIIPCGHTLCKACSDNRSNCPSCDCPIVSLTVNIMLQQVIQEYHSHPVPSTLSHSVSPTSAKVKGVRINEQETVCKYSVEDNRRNVMASYKAQLANLYTRQEILSTEQASLQQSEKSLSSKIQQEKSQLQGIKHQEEEVQKAISSLQERQAALREHRKQYEDYLSGLEDEKKGTMNKIALLSTTISSLKREIEKVKLLSENGY